MGKNFERPNDANRDNEYEIELSAVVESTHVSVEVIVRVTNVNEPPAFELESTEFSVEENTSANRRVGGALKVIDPDDGDSWSFSVEGEGADFFHIDTEGQIRVRPGAVLDYETSGILSLTALVTDQGGLSDSLPVEVTLTDADDPGVIAFSSNRPFVGMSFTATVSDQDGVTGRIRWRWHRAMNADDEFERIDGATRSSYTPVEVDEGYTLRVTVSYEDNFEVGASASGISTTVGKNTVPQFEAPSITLTVSEEAPAGTDVGDPVAATDSDGDDLTYALSGEDASYFAINDSTGQISVRNQALPDSETKASYTVIVVATDQARATASITVKITTTASNARPTIDGAAAVDHAENDTASVATYTAIDPDGDEITWGVEGSDAARFSISEKGELTFNSVPDYEKPRDANKDNVYGVTVAASDGNLTAELALDITVTNVNEAVSIDGATAVDYVENDTASVATYTAIDPDGDEITWSVEGSDAARFSISEKGELTFNSVPDYEKPRDANKDNVYGVTVAASDGNLTAELALDITVTNVNEAVSIDGATAVDHAENDTASVATYTAIDPDGDEITWGVEGSDAARFSISEAGELTFNSLPDYENPNDANENNVYEVTVTASDGNLTAELDVEVTVTNVNETLSISGSTSVIYTENGATTVSVYSATDFEGNGIMWSLGAVDAARFSISELGELTFNSPPDYEKPRDANKDNVYEVTVKVAHENLMVELDVEVTVTNVNEAPSISGLASVTYAENSTTTVAVYSAADPDSDAVTWSISGADAKRFAISELGELTFNSPPDYENPNDANKDNVYEVTVAASDSGLESTLDIEVTVTDVAEAILITGPATVNYAENDTASVATYAETDPDGDEIKWDIAGADEARFSIRATGELKFNFAPDYENPNDANKDNVYEVTVAASGGNLTAELYVEVTVTNVNEAAAISGLASISYLENDTVSVAIYSATDPEGDGITWGIEGADAARFTLNVEREVSFNSPPDYEESQDANSDNVYEVTVTALDGNLTAKLDVEVTVTNVNEPVTITGSTSVTYAENDTTVLAVYSATDPEGSSITWEVVDTDAAWISISELGELSFNLPPDYENPKDANKDNVYELTVAASDGDLTSALDVEVTVTNVTEPATITGPVTVNYKENGKGLVATYTLVDPDRGDGNLPSWEVVGTDAAHFVIDNQGGLAFVLPPNFENPVDADADNKYLLQIVKNGGGTESGLDVTVEVTDANDAPRFSSTAIVAEIPENSCPGAYTLYRGISGSLDIETDEDGDTLTYALSGPDSQTFVIHPSTGYVTLGPGTLLDFETSRKPFKLRVSVSDGRDEFGNAESEFVADDHLDLMVNVENIDEPPVFAEAQLILDKCGIPVAHKPGQLRRTVTADAHGGSPVGVALLAKDPERKHVHFRVVSQSDHGAFIIDSKSGQIMVAPDFSPRDARRVYTLRIAATDGDLESTIEVRISVKKAPKPTPAPDVEDSPAPNPESANDAEVSTSVQGEEGSGDSLPRDGNTTNSAHSPEILDRPPTSLKQVEPMFVAVPHAAQVPLFGGVEVQDQAGRVRLTAPAGALAVPYQVRLTQDDGACIRLSEKFPSLVCVCVSVEFFDAAGAPLAQELLNRPVLLEIVLRTQDEGKNSESRDERVEIGHDSVKMMRQDDKQEWGYIPANLREPADGSSILMTRLRSPGQYMALVTESGAESEASVSTAPLNFMKLTTIQQTQKAVEESALKRTVPFFYDPVAVRPEPEPTPLVSTEPQVWYMARLMIALLLDVMVAVSAVSLLQRSIFRRY